MNSLGTGSLVVWLMVSIAYGQSRPNKWHPTTSRADSAPMSKYLIDQFASDQTSVGPNFLGHDILAAVTAIRNSAALKEKGEFETSQSFAARKASFVRHPLYGHVLPDSTLAYVLEARDTFRFEYDADPGTLSVTVSAESAEDSEHVGVIWVKDIRIEKGTYRASNAFGVQAQVRRAVELKYGVAVDPRRSPAGHELTMQVRLSPDAARTAERYGKLLVLCQLAGPLGVFGDSERTSPTIYDHEDVTVDTSYFRVDPIDLWLFDSRTGTIISKLSQQDGLVAYPRECLDRPGHESMRECLARVGHPQR